MRCRKASVAGLIGALSAYSIPRAVALNALGARDPHSRATQPVDEPAEGVGAIVNRGAQAAHSGHYYRVCGAAANQMLGHAANIALAVSRQEAVMIPDTFIVDATRALDSATLTPTNSIPLQSVFDIPTLVEKIATFGIKANLVPYAASIHDPLECSWSAALEAADASFAKEILKAMVPSEAANRDLNIVQSAMLARVSTQFGSPTETEYLNTSELTSFLQSTMGSAVCFHHPDSEDWHRHCDQWELLSPENHCRNQEPIAQLVRRRISHLSNPWVFYAGDHEVPKELRSLKVPVITRGQIVSSSFGLLAPAVDNANASMPRDLGSLLDYFLCSRMPVFIGNSVSLWSASQIVIRDSMASWYNSFGIPLARFFKSYIVPIVYTYTEDSSREGKLLLKVSVLSVRNMMPAASIHVLYNGEHDLSFPEWLIEHGVVVHQHNPAWRNRLETMRRALVDNHTMDSHLYASSGNFFGTFQRIDIPEFLSVEYCILLDADTIVVRPFTLADFGTHIPEGLAFSSDMKENDDKPQNAGVALLNVPYLRKRLGEFRTFVFNHTDGNFKRGPGDQGAFLDFYGGNIKYLSTRFNTKPHYKNNTNWDNSYIIHYQGLKPNDQIEYWFGGTCDPLKCSLMSKFHGSPHKCDAMVKFAKAASIETSIIKTFCSQSLKQHSDLCVDLLDRMAHGEGGNLTGQRTCTKYLKGVILSKGLNPDDFPNIDENATRLLNATHLLPY